MFLREHINIFVITQHRVGQHRALEAIHENMRPGEHVMAFLDDIYTTCRPERWVKCTRRWTTIGHPTQWDRDDQGYESVET